MFIHEFSDLILINYSKHDSQLCLLSLKVTTDIQRTTTTVLKSCGQRLTLITSWGQMIEDSDAYISVVMPILFPILYVVLLSKEWHILLCHSLLFTLLNLFAACFVTKTLRLILSSIYCQLAESLVKWQSYY